MSIWWTIMVAIGAVNWLAAIYLFYRSFAWVKQEPEYAKYISILRVCGLIFASVALYRSVFVSSYPNRLAWFDTVFNSPFIVRSLATFAEMSFIGLIAVVLLRLNNDMKLTDNPVLRKTPVIAMICILLAQPLAFGGLILQSNLQFFIEESLWGAAFLVIFPLVLVGLRKVRKQDAIPKSIKAFFVIMAIWCAGYLAFQLFFALPFLYFPVIAEDAGRIIPPDAL